MQRKTPFLFWAIVVGCSMIIFALWLLSVKDNVAAFSQSLQQGITLSSDRIKEDMARSQAEASVLLKKSKQPVLTDEQLGQITDQIKQLATTSAENEVLPVADKVTVKNGGTVSSDEQTCARSGGLYEARKTKSGTPFNVCVFLDGSECEATAFANGECHKGQYARVDGELFDLPDLLPEITQAGYCRKSGGVWQLLDQRANATHVCFNSLVVRNQARATSLRSTVTVDTQSFVIPALDSGDGFTVSKLAPIEITDSMKEIRVMVDANEKIKERDEKNNIAVFLVEVLK